MERKFWEYSFSWKNSFIGTKVLGTFAPEERKFHGSESSKERMFHGTKVPRERKFSLWTFRSRERKCRGTKRHGFFRTTPTDYSKYAKTALFLFYLLTAHRHWPNALLIWSKRLITEYCFVHGYSVKANSGLGYSVSFRFSQM